MDKSSFTEEDKNKLIEFLNFIAVKAEFNGWKTEDSIKHFRLLSYLQQTILPKIEKHILEVGEVKKMKESEEG